MGPGPGQIVVAGIGKDHLEELKVSGGKGRN
jgi:hypothetical protein